MIKRAAAPVSITCRCSGFLNFCGLFFPPAVVKPGYASSGITRNFLTAKRTTQSRISEISRMIHAFWINPAIQYPTKETAEIRPQYPYALTKRLGEETVLHWGQVYGLPVVTLRLFNVYGTRSRTSGTYGAVFGVFLAQKLAGKPFTVVGDGNQTRDFTYVTDIADVFYTAAVSDVAQDTFNVGSGGTYSVNRLCELLGGEVTHIPKRPGEPDCTFADTTKIEAELGWKAKVSFEEGVQKVLDNIAYWKEAPVWTPESIGVATEDWFKYLS